MKPSDAFVALINQHRAILHKICRLYADSNHDRQDLYQEIMIQLWKSFPGFRNESLFGTWLYRVALNTAIGGLRKKKVKTVNYEPGQMQGLPQMEQTNDEEMQLQLLYKAMGQLNEIDRAMVMLYLEDKSYDEMEAILGISQNNLRVKMNRVREKLRKLIKQEGHGA